MTTFAIMSYNNSTAEPTEVPGTWESVRLAAANYVYASTVSGTIIVVHFFWSLLNCGIPSLRTNPLFSFAGGILNSAMTVHVLLIFYLAPSTYAWTYWTVTIAAGIAALYSLVWSGYTAYLFLRRSWRYGVVFWGPRTFVQVNEDKHEAHYLPPVMMIQCLPSGIEGVEKWCLLGLSHKVMNTGSWNNPRIMGFCGSDKYTYHDSNQKLDDKETPGITYRILKRSSTADTVDSLPAAKKKLY